jgi:hypothetical protein
MFLHIKRFLTEEDINLLANSSAEQVYQFFKDLKPLKERMHIVMGLKIMRFHILY